MSQQPDGRKTLEQLFSEAGIARPSTAQPAAAVEVDLAQPIPDAVAQRRNLRGKRRAYLFAGLWVKHRFNAMDAYSDFKRILEPLTASQKRWAYAYANSPPVCRYAREIIQEATEKYRRQSVDDIQQMLELNRILIHGDMCDLLEQARIYDYLPDKAVGKEGESDAVRRSYRQSTRMRDLSTLSKTDRLLVKKIRFKDGEVVGLEVYDRLDAESKQLAILEVIHRRGGSDKDWIRDLRDRLSVAREQRIEMEIARGKVIRLPGAKAAAARDPDEPL